VFPRRGKSCRIFQCITWGSRSGFPEQAAKYGG
jgi:hypothetical protein